MFEFPCPHCSVSLRMRDQALRGRVISCPDCGQPVLIQELKGTLTGVAPESRSSSSLPVRRAPLSGRGPRMIAMGVAGLLLIGVLAYVWSGRRAPAPADARKLPNPPQAAIAPPQPAKEQPDQQEAQAPQEGPVVAAEGKLRDIYDLLAGSIEREHAFPLGAGLADQPDARFSWIAGLAGPALGAAPVHWERAWDDPANDEFIRRRFPAFLNPDVAAIAGQNGLPTTHFVGVSGVGENSHQFPATDPRAGIFSDRRRTTSEDVSDGLSNTLLIAGICDHLGSWAAPGPATMRGFRKEPYINGPDGFGTGQQDGMAVLMADGSTRFLNRKMEPVVLRRLAAMADGLPLDPAAPGDPLELALALEAEKPLKNGPPAATDPPLEVLLAPDPPPVDIHGRLTQRLVAFEQPRATPLEDVLFDLQELLGVPVDLSRLSQETRRAPVMVAVRDATLTDVLDKVCSAADIAYDIEQFRIVVRPRSP